MDPEEEQGRRRGWKLVGGGGDAAAEAIASEQPLASALGYAREFSGITPPPALDRYAPTRAPGSVLHSAQ